MARSDAIGLLLQKEAMGQLWIVLAKHYNLRQESHA
jgi:hypothetical protein